MTRGVICRLKGSEVVRSTAGLQRVGRGSAWAAGATPRLNRPTAMAVVAEAARVRRRGMRVVDICAPPAVAETGL